MSFLKNVTILLKIILFPKFGHFSNGNNITQITMQYFITISHNKIFQNILLIDTYKL